MRVMVVLLVLGGLLLGVMAQDDEVKDTVLTCDYDELISTQAEMTALLEDFQTQIDDTPLETLGQLYEVGAAYQELAIACGFIPEDIGERFVGTDVDIILTALENVNGDPLNGQLLYNNEANAADGAVLGCVGYHEAGEIAPATEGTWTRWDEIHSQEEQFADYTFEHYAVESIIHPWDYTVEGYPANTMPNNFGDRLSYQDLADLISYLESQDQFLD